MLEIAIKMMPSSGNSKKLMLLLENCILLDSYLTAGLEVTL